MFKKIYIQINHWWCEQTSLFQNIILIVLAILVGSFYGISLVDSAVIPTNISWLLNGGDFSQHYLGWVFYRNDPDWHFPLSITRHLIYPTGIGIGYTDSIPIVALITKIFSGVGLLPVPFQYFGLIILTSFTLQIYFGMRIGLLVSRNNLILAILFGLLIIQSPPLMWRICGHIALTNQWVILCAIWLYLQEEKQFTTKDILLSRLVLILIAGGIHPYLAVMTLLILIASYFRLLLEKKCQFSRVLTWSITTIICLLFSWYIFGYLSGAATEITSGYTDYSLNLLALFNPYSGTSVILPPIPHVTHGQAEGYSYLGLGVILLLVTNLFYVKKSFNQLFSPALLPLTLTCLFLTLFAVTTKVTFGPFTLFSVELPESLLSQLGIFRASGRMIWPVYYLIFVGLFAVTLRYWNQSRSLLILIMVIAIQFVDLHPLRLIVTDNAHLPPESSPLIAREWQEVNFNHDKLIVLPPYQCGNFTEEKPNFVIFASLAAEQKLKINSFYAARMSVKDRKFHCREFPETVKSGILEDDAAYVMSQQFYNSIASREKITSHYCSIVDNFVLCRRRVNNISSAV